MNKSNKYDISINLKNPDHEYQSQGDISDYLMKNCGIEKSDIVSVSPESVVINLGEPEDKKMYMTQVTGLKKDLDKARFKLGLNPNNPMTYMFSDGGGDAGAAGGDSSPAGVGATDGIGAANLRGTTLIPTAEGSINIDDVIHDPESYSEGCPVVSYAVDGSYVTMPDQTVYSIGEVSLSAVSFLNSELESKFELYASDEDENSGDVSLKDHYPKHHKTNTDLRDYKKNPYIAPLRDRKDIQSDPDNVPVKNLLVNELREVIKQGVQEGSGKLPTCTSIKSQKVHQDMLSYANEAVSSAFSSDNSLTNRLILAGTKKLARKGISSTKDKIGDKLTSALTNQKY